MRKGQTLYLTHRRLAAARAALRACEDPDVRAAGLAWLRNARPGYLYNLLPDVHPNVRAAREVVADALLREIA